MLLRLIFVFVFAGLSNTLHAGDSTSVVFVDGRKNRMDLFVNAGLSKNYNHFQPRASFGVGLIRTVSQQRFFPVLTVGINYDLLQNRSAFFGPDLHCSLSALQVNKQSGNNHFWMEYMAGIRYSSAGRIQFISGLSAGWFSEFFQSQLKEGYSVFGTWGYNLSFGLGYAL